MGQRFHISHNIIKKLFVAKFCWIDIIHVKSITGYLVNEAFIQLRKYVQITWKLV